MWNSLTKDGEEVDFDSIQLAQHLKHEYQDKHIKVLNVADYLKNLFL